MTEKPTPSPVGRGAALRVAALSMLAATMVGVLTLLAFVHYRRDITGKLAWDHLDLIWASPLSYGILYLAGFLALVPIVAIWPRRGLQFALACFGGFAVLGVMILFPKISQWSSLIVALGAGVQFWRLGGKPFPALERTVTRFSIAVTALYLLVLGGTMAHRATRDRDRASAAVATREHPNVILLIWDTVRAVNLSAYGYPTRTTPNVEALASEGVLFERAYSNAPWTLPSHSSFFTGRNAGELSADWDTPLDDTYPTIAQVLRDAGYETVALNGNAFYGGGTTGLSRGFDRYSEHRRSWRQIMYSSSFGQTASLGKFIRTPTLWSIRSAITKLNLSVLPVFAEYDIYYARNVTDDFVAWSRERDASRPYFAFLNFYDAHETEALRPWEKHVVEGAKTRLERYDRELVHLDSLMGRLVADLRARGELDRTIFIMSSDHGEHFGEHDLQYGHGVSLYEQTLRVPLVIRYPKGLPAGVRVAEPVQLRDLGATILDLAKIPTPFPGRSLAHGFAPEAPTVAVADTFLHEVSQRIRETKEVPNKDHPLKSLRTDSLNYIRRRDGKEELYAYRVDSMESVNLVDSTAFREPLDRLRARMKAVTFPWR